VAAISLGFAPQAFADFEWIHDFYAATDAALARTQVELITEAVGVLARHPMIGRLVQHGLRELVISRGKSGYVALYRYRPDADSVLVLRIRHQRELGW
jgi:plasmid stabilization system protein ParE